MHNTYHWSLPTLKTMDGYRMKYKWIPGTWWGRVPKNFSSLPSAESIWSGDETKQYRLSLIHWFNAYWEMRSSLSTTSDMLSDSARFFMKFTWCKPREGSTVNERKLLFIKKKKHLLHVLLCRWLNMPLAECPKIESTSTVKWFERS